MYSLKNHRTCMSFKEKDIIIICTVLNFEVHE